MRPPTRPGRRRGARLTRARASGGLGGGSRNQLRTIGVVRSHSRLAEPRRYGGRRNGIASTRFTQAGRSGTTMRSSHMAVLPRVAAPQRPVQRRLRDVQSGDDLAQARSSRMHRAGTFDRFGRQPWIRRPADASPASASTLLALAYLEPVRRHGCPRRDARARASSATTSQRWAAVAAFTALARAASTAVECASTVRRASPPGFESLLRYKSAPSIGAGVPSFGAPSFLLETRYFAGTRHPGSSAKGSPHDAFSFSISTEYRSSVSKSSWSECRLTTSGLSPRQSRIVTPKSRS